jgi:hypothetical protein
VFFQVFQVQILACACETTSPTLGFATPTAMSSGPKHKTSLLRLPCITCNRYFRNQSGLTKHRRTHHLHAMKPKVPAKPPMPAPHEDHDHSVGIQSASSGDSVEDADEDADLALYEDDHHSEGIQSAGDWQVPVEGANEDADMASDVYDSGDEAEDGEPSDNDTVYHPLLNGQCVSMCLFLSTDHVVNI